MNEAIANTEVYDLLESVAGKEKAQKIYAAFLGCKVYFPKRIFMKIVRDRRIYKAFDGSNYKELAERWNLSERQIKRIIAKEIAERQRVSPASPEGRARTSN
jgi:Mor family transcriptional regulator